MKLFSFFMTISHRVSTNIPNFVIVGFLGLSYVTLYSIASRLIRYFNDFVHSATALFGPVYSQYEGKGDHGSIVEKFILTTKIGSYLSIFIGGCMIIFGKAFISRWMGEEYLSAYPVLVILTVAAIITAAQKQSISVLLGISKHKFIAVTSIIEGIVILILTLLLVRKYGLVGVALGTAVPRAFFYFFINPIYTCRVIRLSVSKYYFNILIPIFVKSATFFSISWYIINGLVLPSYLNLVFLSALNFLAFIIAFIFIGLNNEERSYLKKLVYK